MLRRFRNYFIRRATALDLTKKVAVLWNPQGVRDFREVPSYREGFISHVGEDGSFWITFFDSGSTMVCPAMIFGRRKNPFKNLLEL